MPTINPMPRVPFKPVTLGPFKVLSQMPIGGNADVFTTTEGAVYRFTLLFGVDSAQVDLRSVHALTQVVWGRSLQNYRFDLIGTASRSGTTQHNLGLSGRRLLSVQTLLTQYGVPAAIAYSPHDLTTGEELPADQGAKDGIENATHRCVICYAGPSAEALQKFYLYGGFVFRLQYALWHRNAALA